MSAVVLAFVLLSMVLAGILAASDSCGCVTETVMGDKAAKAS
jgi:hypothetical protein